MAVALEVRTRRTWPQRLLISFNCVLIASCLAGAGWLGYIYKRFGDLERVSIPSLRGGGGDEGGTGNGTDEDLPPLRPGDPQNFLLVGSDSRDFVTSDDDTESFGDGDGTARADTILLVRLDQRARTAAMVSFPRDLLVDIAGERGDDRINTAFEGGPDPLVRTVVENFGVPIDHYVQVTFEGFRGLVDAVDGVRVYLRGPVRDRNPETGQNLSGLNVTDSGCVTLGGEQALAYVRSRNFEQFIDDPNDSDAEQEWVRDRSSDLGRIQRQQSFIMRAVGKALDEGLLDPRRVSELLDVAQDTVIFDRGLGLDDVSDLAAQFRAFSPESVQQFQLRVIDRTIRGTGARVLELDPDQEARNAEIFATFRGEAVGTATLVPADVSVQVLNGSGREGEAGAGTEGLAGAGFDAGGATDNPEPTATTIIRYASGQRPAADLVARHLTTPPSSIVEVAGQEVDVVVVTGTDYTGILPFPRSEGATTTTAPSGPTTVAPTTSTTLDDEAAQAQFYAGVAEQECYRSE